MHPEKNFAFCTHKSALMFRIKILITCIPLACIVLHCGGQSDPGVTSARAHGMAGIGMTLDAIDAVYSNPAGLSGIERTSLHAGSAQSFGLSPLTQANAAAAIRTGENGILFMRAGQFGFSAYQERQLGLGYAMSLSDNLNAALRFDLYQFSIEGYGSAMLPGFLLGIQYKLGNVLSFGAAVRNPVEITTHDAITLPATLSAGLSYRPTEAVGLYAEIEKDIDFSPRLKFGVEYRIVDALELRVGSASNPGTFHAGVGLRVRESLSIDLGAGYHVQLGFTPALGIGFTPA
jgi:long-subunit fatty acid transport protein